MTKRRKPWRHKARSTATGLSEHVSLLQELPEELLQLVLDKLAPKDLVILLHSSKVMAQRVLQHSSGRLELRIQAVPGRNWAATSQLLQCAPPACLRLRLQCATQRPESCPLQQQQQQQQQHTRELGNEALHAVLGVLGQQMPCITELCLQGFTVSSTTPSALAAKCPNLHTLQLKSCCLEARSSNQQRNKRNNGAGGIADIRPANSIHTLMLADTSLPEMILALRAGVRVTRQMQQAHDFAAQLKESLPQLSCLHLEDENPPQQLIHLWASQLTDLHMPSPQLPIPLLLERHIDRLQHLQKLVLPTSAALGADLKRLLRLHSLRHLELETINPMAEDLFIHDWVPEDLSSHPCTWRFLQLHLGDSMLSLEGLARTPLHSLQAPLQLGSGQPGACVRVELPGIEDQENLTALQTIASRLQQCGVLLKADELCWKEFLGADDEEQHQAAALAAISPALGPRAKVSLEDMTVGAGVIQSLAATHRDTLTCLSFTWCELEDSMAQAALTQLPLLRKLEFADCFWSFWGLGAWLHSAGDQCHRLIEAMAQQPAGRSLEAWLQAPCILHTPALHIFREWLLELLQSTSQLHTSVALTAQYTAQEESRDGSTWLVLTFLHKHPPE